MQVDKALVAVSTLWLALALTACSNGGGGGSSGTATFSKSYGGNNGDEATCAIPTSNGGYLFVGGYGSIVSNEEFGVEGDADVWVVELDELGNVRWQRSYGEPAPTLSPGVNKVRFDSAREALDGGFWLCGSEARAPGPNYTGDPDIDGGNFVVARFNADHQLLWQNVYDSGIFPDPRPYFYVNGTTSASAARPGFCGSAPTVS